MLKTGAIMQYPAAHSISYASRVVSFLDGTDQRYREYGLPLRKWVIQLSLLGDDELSLLEHFFASQEGRSGSFTFTDPWTQTEYSDCSIDESSLELRFVEDNRGEGRLIVAENRM
jgi:hypothetical protein